MTLEEAIKHCEEVAETNERICDTESSIGLPDIYMHKDEAKKCAEEHRQLAEWLKELKAYKEQSGDAISRQEALNAITMAEARWQAVDNVNKLPSATPQQRTGWWVQKEEESDAEPFIIWECSECHGYQRKQTAFCPNCGAKMEVEE